MTVLTEILGKDKTTPSAMLPDLAVPGASREVDICAEGEVAGHKVLVGIECRDIQATPNGGVGRGHAWQAQPPPYVQAGASSI